MSISWYSQLTSFVISQKCESLLLFIILGITFPLLLLRLLSKSRRTKWSRGKTLDLHSGSFEFDPQLDLFTEFSIYRWKPLYLPKIKVWEWVESWCPLLFRVHLKLCVPLLDSCSHLSSLGYKNFSCEFPHHRTGFNTVYEVGRC